MQKKPIPENASKYPENAFLTHTQVVSGKPGNFNFLYASCQNKTCIYMRCQWETRVYSCKWSTDIKFLKFGWFG